MKMNKNHVGMFIAVSAMLCVSASTASADVIAAWNYGGTATYIVEEDFLEWHEDPVQHTTNGVTVTDWTNERPPVGEAFRLHYSNNGYHPLYEFNSETVTGYYFTTAASYWNSTFEPDLKYLSLTVTALPGQTVTLTSLNYNSLWAEIELAPPTYRLGYSLNDGVTWTYSSERQVILNAEADDYGHYLTNYAGESTMDTWDFDNDVTLTEGSTIVFGLWAYGPLNFGGGGNVSGDVYYVSEQGGESTSEFVLNGTLLSVPEPSSSLLLLLGCSAWIAKQTRRCANR